MGMMMNAIIFIILYVLKRQKAGPMTGKRQNRMTEVRCCIRKKFPDYTGDILTVTQDAYKNSGETVPSFIY
jgi:hypothetical protein